MKRIKTEKGITLVALIITIVVLLILAGVAIATVRDSDIIGYANQAKTSYAEGKNDEDSAIKGFEDLLDEVTLGKSGKAYKYAGDVEEEMKNAIIIITSDNNAIMVQGGIVMQYSLKDMTSQYTVENKNLNINSIKSVVIEGKENGAVLGFSNDGIIYMGQIDGETNSIAFDEQAWLEETSGIDVKPYLSGNVWEMRGLTAVKPDVQYKGIVEGNYVGYIFESNGGLNPCQNGIPSEEPLTSAEISEEIADEKWAIIGNDTFSMGSYAFKFIDNGEKAQIIMNDQVYATLTIDFVYEEIDLTVPKTRVYMYNDSQAATMGYMLKENGEWWAVSGDKMQNLGLNYQIHHNVKLTVGGVEREYETLFYANSSGSENKYLYYGEFTNGGRTLKVWKMTGASEDGLSYDTVEVMTTLSLDETKTESDFTVVESE